MVDSTEHPQIKIADFGLSKCFAPNDPLATMCGSPQVPAAQHASPVCVSVCVSLCPATVCPHCVGAITPNWLGSHLCEQLNTWTAH